MKKLFALIFTFVLSANVFAQNDAQKIYDTEKAFARAADEKGIKPAFLEFLADDGIIFNPTAMNGKQAWQSRPDSPALLSWYPVYIDVSSNGALSYSTGAGEYRPKGKTDAIVYYSEYATIWRRQADGSYKAALDIGVSQNKPESSDINWTSPKTAEKFPMKTKPPASNAISAFYDAATTKGLSRAYKIYAAPDARFLRDEKFPIIGKQNAPTETKKSKITFGKSATTQSAGDLAYTTTTYQMKDGANVIETGNVLQVWKLIGGQWQIVLDVFSQIPPEKK